ncbi:MAG: 2'-5' RNA ligase family protein [Adhaeribacter sp.]
MLAITSLLDAKHADLVSTIIQDFQKEFGLKQVQATPLPHITYLIAQTYNIDLLKDYLLRLCHTARPVHAYTTGIGVFPGEHPVIYIPVLRTQPLNKMHSHLYQDISKMSMEVGSFTKPKLWLPHISLAVGDTSTEMMTPIFRYLARFNFDWEILLDNLTIFQESKQGDTFELESSFLLANKVLN